VAETQPAVLTFVTEESIRDSGIKIVSAIYGERGASTSSSR
jgi:hypothetical protein